MANLSADGSSSSDVQSLIDARCNDFERAWIAGQSPSMEDFLRDVPDTARGPLLRALLMVELEHHRDQSGAPLSEEQLLKANPRLATSLSRAFQELRALGTRHGAAADQTIQLPHSANEAAHTVEHTPSRKDSRGLHIRCPHCSNQVELLADTPYESINCSTCGSIFSLVHRADETKASRPLKTIGRFDLISRLGVGGFGTVWKARDRELHRVVAIKIPRRGQLSPAEIEQFFREARAAAQLRHANIVPVHEVGRDGETLFIVSDYVRGVTLSDWLTGRRPSPSEVAELGAIVSDGLHHAHQQGVVHRDLKPPNIMIDEEGQPHIMDFGLAKREVGEITMTVDGQILGTPAYMSPEQAGGEGHWTDRRTDIYSLGVILFEMLAGELPFRGNHQMQIHQRLTEDPPDPRKLNRNISRDLSTICLKCMEREPGRRYSTSADLAADLRRFLSGEPILARPLSAPARLIRWTKRKPMIATTAALIIFLAIAGPLAAALIERQRGRLAELVSEKNNLIDKYAQEKSQDAGKITQLTDKLAVWEGRANPWEFWPPKHDELPRQKLIPDLFKHANATLSNRLPNAPSPSLELARGHLGLAMLADSMNRQAEAIASYKKAHEQLIALRADDSQQPALARALADCSAQLARLVGSNDRAAAKEYFLSARTIHEKLAAADPSDMRRQVAWLESELNSATLAGFESAGDNLKRADDISKALSANWPREPDAVYRLACFLSQREPELAMDDSPSDH